MRRFTHKQLRQGAATTARTLLLLVISFAVLQTLLLLLGSSGKDMYDVVDPMVKWIPREFKKGNYVRAFEVLGGTSAIVKCLIIYSGTAAAQVLSSAVIAYGFARYRFPGRGVLFALMVATFFVPQQIIFLPRYVLFSKYKMLGTVWTLFLPTVTGQGIKNALLILVFWQFIRTIPASLDEAAMIDGAGLLRTFVRIDMPLAIPGIVICSVLSFAWNWNDTFFADTYFKGAIPNVTLTLGNLRDLYSGGVSSNSADEYFHTGIEVAAAVLVLLPPLMLYLVFEKRLIESVDRVGITGE